MLFATLLLAAPFGGARAATPADTRQGTHHASAEPTTEAEPSATVSAVTVTKITPHATVKGLTVTASNAIPKVETTFPAAGAKVSPGLLILRVTFSTRMRGDGWSYVPSNKGAYPDCGESPRLLDDQQTFVLICRTLPSRTYAVWFNKAPLVDFSSHSGRSAPPLELVFTTTGDEPLRTLDEAMRADKGLGKFSNPVEGYGLAAMGQPHVPPED